MKNIYPIATVSNMESRIIQKAVLLSIALILGGFGTVVSQTTFSYTGSSTTYTVPAGVNSLTMEAYGAAGGYSDDGSAGNTRPGYGARMRGTFMVTPGQVLKVLVGGQGRPVTDNPSGGNQAGGGGGGTFVTDNSNNPMIVAGGGGGENWTSFNVNGVDAVTTNTGTSGGTTAGRGAGGGGFITNGTNYGSNSIGGYSFLNGGAGGNGDINAGGFGGGGGVQFEGGGGGGYNGGNVIATNSYDAALPTAAGSYNIGTSQSNSAGANSGNGSLTITTNAVVQGISYSGFIIPFVSVSGAVSAEQSFIVYGSSVTNNISITVPTGFEVSTTSGSGFASSLTLTQTGGFVSSTTIYVRLTNSASGTPSGNISMTSAGSTTKNLAVSGTVYSVPSTQSSSLLFSSVMSGQAVCSWTNGNGTNRIVFMKAAASGSASPVNSTTYTASTSFASGIQIGSTGWYCVYNGTGSSFTVTGLSTTIYSVMVMEYNGVTNAQAYNTSSASNNLKTFLPTIYTGSIQTYTVPAGITSITIEAFGAGGGYSDDGSAGNTRPGYGARMRGTFTVTPGQILKVLVGGQGRPVSDNPAGGNQAGGGGGGSFVTDNSNVPMIVAGGGGGENWISFNVNGVDAVTTNTGTSGGTTAGRGGSGGGFSTNGATYSASIGGYSFLNGGAAGTGDINAGGFGGGGGAQFEGGGGGGYNGGNVIPTNSYDAALPAAAGSYNNGTNQSNSAGANSGNGSVSITCNVTQGISTSGSLAAFTSLSGTASTPQSFTASGTVLTADIIVTAPTGFEVSLSSGSGYAGSITLTQSGGSVSSTAVYVRLTSSATGTPSGNVTLTSTGATTQNVAVSGTVYLAPTISSFTPTYGANYTTVTITGTNFTGVTAVSFGGTAATSFTIVNATTITAIPGAAGTSGNVSVTNPGATASLAGFSWLASTANTISYTGSLQSFVVPPGVTTMDIETWGAEGGGAGSNSLAGGKGARMKGTFVVTPGETLNILVGQKGGTGALGSDPNGNENGGGGGTFVVRQTGNTPLIISGGGGGGPSTTNGLSCSRTASYADGQTGTSGVTSATCNGYTGAGGSSGNGGSTAGSYEGGAGGGFSTNGANGGTHCVLAYGGKSYLNGGAGGTGNTCYVSNYNNGGYGGGGGGQLSGPGAGGGYSGGGTAGEWSGYSTYGGGGGSYNNGTNPSNTAGNRSGNGQVTLTYATTTSVTSFTPASSGNGLTVTITGTNFTGATAVSFGGTAATSYSVVNATTITAVVGAGTSGSVSVTAPYGTASLAGFTWVACPVISSFSPVYGGNFKETTITGSNFTAATAVSFGGTAASSYTVVSSTSIKAFAGASGTSGNVSVTTAGGTGTSSGFTWTATTANTYNYTGSLQTFTVPAGVTNINIETWGAEGGGAGSNSLAGGKGARMKGTFSVTPGEILNILVGQKGGTGASVSDPNGNENGGGGGTFVVRQTGNTPLIISGGGGGGPSTTNGLTCSRTASTADGQTGTSGVTSATCNGYTGAGGSGGNGGSTAGSYEGGAGGGFSTDGANGGTHCVLAYGGKSYLNGGAGGTGNTCYVSNYNNGGYGGGGGGQLSGPGAGGGYSGGGTAGEWSAYSTYGGGGGSYNIGTFPSNTAGARSGNGLVTITYNASLEPSITTTGTLSAFTTLTGTASAAQSFTASGALLTANILIAAPTGFEVSTASGSGYASSITITHSGGMVANTTIYVRMTSAATGTPSGNVTLNSTGITTVNVAATGTVYAAPTTQATNITFSSTTDVSTNISWTIGNGSTRAVFMKAANTGTASPVNGTTYTANTSFGSGTQIGSTGWYCIYNGTGTSVAVTNMVAATAYDIMVIEYNGVAGSQAYFTSASTNNPITYSSSTSTFNYSGAIVNWTVPAGITSITIDTYGAQGGSDLCSSGYNYGGYGARMKGTFTVVPGNILQLLVGGVGGNSANACNRGGGGGGGTFVYNSSTSALMVAAGGGGGAGQLNCGSASNANANSGTDGNAGFQAGYGAGGTGGAGGGAASMAAGGAGWNSNGASGSYGTGGTRFLAGGAGGTLYSDGGNGGFGGGGGCYAGAGGGGGYSGGGGGGWSMSGWGGGGGSYNNGTSTTNTGGARSGNGLATITFIGSSPIISKNGEISAFATYLGSASVAQSTIISGINLTTDITVTAPTGYEVSLTAGSGYASSITLTPTNGIVTSTSVYVRLTSASTGTPSGNVALTSTGATTYNVAVSGTVYVTPTTQASEVILSSTSDVSSTISWTNGNGSRRAVFVKVASSGTAAPVNGTTYTPNTAFGSGTQIASTGWYCVYVGTGTSVAVTSLTTSNPFTVMVVEFNGIDEAQAYFTSSAINNPRTNIATTNTFNYSGSIVNWTVPAGVTSITIDSYGAQGGSDLCSSGYNYGGYGAQIKGTFTVAPGNILQILSGGVGGNSANTCNRGGGGGGGTFVYNSSTSSLMVAAGGGGGAGQLNCGSASNANANATSDGNAGFQSGYGAGGTGGAGGGAASMAAGGAGWNSNGASGSYGTGGTRFLAGGAGGVLYSDGGNGGFGGGGGCYAGAGGGGGYSGGGGGGWSMSGWGGGGGSYNNGSNAVNTGGAHSGNGLVTITTYSTGPTISSTGTLTAFSIYAGAPSVAQSLVVSGARLTSDITVTAPTGFEVSLAFGSGYAGSIAVAQTSGTVASTTIYIRIKSTSLGSVSGNIAFTSTDVVTLNVAASGTVFSAPTTQASNLTFSTTSDASTNVAWTNGNGSSRAVFIKLTNAGSALPVNGITYTANTSFGSGTQIGSTGWYCVYNGTGGSVAVYNLVASSLYMIMVVEFNGVTGAQSYNTSTATHNPNSFSSVVNTFNFSGAIVNWTVPAGVTSVTIDAYGAQGGSDLCSSGYNYGGYGAQKKGTFTVAPGNILQILAGGVGGNSANTCNRGGGGGGGTFVYNSSTSSLMVAAGGGGGAGQLNCGSASNANANATSDGNAGFQSGYGAGGTGGAGGGAASMAAGGAGWNSNGASGSYGTGGTRFLAGGAGGVLYSDGGNGGFGGGGGCYAGAGGGGGYSGGGGGGWSYSGWGGGGGSYNSGSNLVSLGGAHPGNGLVTITTYYTTLSPTIATSGTLSAFIANAGTASTSQNFSASATGLTANITVTAPAGFEVSLSSGTGYADFITLTQSSGTVSSTTVYVRLTSSAAGTPSGNVALTSTDATTVNVAANGTVNALPTISVQPSASAQNLNLNGSATALTITAAAGSGTISTYQWYKNATNANSGGTGVGTNSAGYTPVTTSAGVLYYYCVVTNSNTGSITSNVSGAITVNALPAISVQPSAGGQTLCANSTATDLSVTASAGSGTISTYQWYKNASNANTGGTTVGTNSSTYTPVTSVAGTLYYYCTVTNSNGGATTTNVLGAILISALAVTASSVTATPATICGGSSSNLNATSTGNTINWYTASTGGTLLGTSASAANYSVTPAATTMYYAEAITSTSGTQTFNYSGNYQSFTVPAGVSSLTIQAYGAQGGTYTNAGGLGGYTTGILAVTAGQILYLYVGQQPTSYAGGYNGGGYGYSDTYSRGGGGASDIRISPYNLADRVLVAAGGGGATNQSSEIGGYGGGTSGGDGFGAAGYIGDAFCGHGATQSTGGAGSTNYGRSTPGSLGQGGNALSAANALGGGGGGGYYGGGAGDHGGGGGGSSYIGGVSGGSTTANQKSGNGQIILSWASGASSCTSASRTPVTITVTPAASAGSVSGSTPLCAGATATYTAASTVLSGGSGAWSSSNTAVATVNSSSGVVTAVAGGTCNIVYTVTGGCGGTKTAQQALTVNTLPTLAAITGTADACVGNTTTFANTQSGGSWSSASTGVATINASSGVITGVSAGTSVITYSYTNGSSCTNSVTKTVTINANLAAPTSISATPASIQTGQSSNLKATSTGTVSWYAAASGGIALGSSASAANYTVTPAATTTYYAEAVPVSGSTGSQTFNYSGAITTFTVPAGVTSLVLETRGAQGGTSGSNAGGLGAYMKGTVTVTPGQVLKVLVGGQGGSGTQGGGGGGSFVTDNSNGALVIAGGGGGGPYNGSYNLSNASGTTGTSGIAGMNSGASATGGAGGTAGTGGSCYTGYPGTSQGAGGGGLTGSGATCSSVGGGSSFISGGAGGATAGSGGAGGFGGGGGADWSYWTGGGGGGGYSGGGGGTYYGVGGGGGSYNGGTSPTNVSGSQSGNGQVVISWTVPSSSGCPSTTRTPVTVTVANPPTVTTAEISASTASTATGGGNVTDIGGSAVTARGVCWSTSTTPTTALNTKTTDGTGSGSFTSGITGLTGETLYYVRAYATNTQGTSYGSQVSFTAFAPGSIAGTQTICSSANPSLFTSATAAVGITGITYQWQSSLNNSTFTDVDGATSATYQAGALSVTTYFRRNAISGVTTMSSNVITVTINAGSASPTVVTATPATILSGATSNLNALVATNNELKWYTAATVGTLLTTVASGVNYAVTPTVTTTYYASASPISCSDNTLENILTNLNSNYANITSQVPSPYNFSMDAGVNSTYISDGGSDMYDGGNYLSTNNSTSFSYSDNSVLAASTIFGTNGKYFTRKVNNLFVLAADMDNVSSFKVAGDYGSDGGGSTSSSTFSVTVGCKTFNCFLSRVYNATDPSINELFIIPANASASHTGIVNTANSYHQLNGITASTRLYYLLYAGSNGGLISDASAQNIATAFISQTTALISADNGCPSATRVPVTVTVSSAPVVTTDAISAIGSTTATGGGNVTADGGSTVTARGVCWSTFASPVVGGSHTSDATGTGTFTSSITPVSAGTTYYVRAYATNAMGTSYGSQVSFAPFALGTFANINKTFGNPAFTLVNPTSSSPGTFSYTSSNTGVATIVGNTVTIVGAGTSTITATQAASGAYASASKTCTLTVAKANQVLTLNPLPTSVPLKDFVGNLLVQASSSSAVPVTITLGSGSAATLITDLGEYYLTSIGQTGTVTIIVNQAGNDNYNSAQISLSFDVIKSNQTIAFAALSVLTYSPGLTSTLSASATSSLGITFTVVSGPGNITVGTQLNITGAGAIVIQASQPGNTSFNEATSVTRMLTVNKATPVITFANISKAYTDPAFTLAATSASTGAFTYSSGNTAVATLSGSTATISGAGSSTLTASQAADADYFAATKDATLTVGKVNQTINLAAIADISLVNFDGNPIQVNATASSGLPVTLTLAGGSEATLNGSNQLVSTGATGSVTVYANQAGDDNYNAATQASESFTVGITSQTITFAALPGKYLSDPAFDLTAASSSDLQISYISSNTGVATISGKTVTIVGLGTTTITASQAGNAYYSAATSVDRNLTVTKEGQTINFDALANKQIGDAPFALSATASSNLAVTYTSSNTSVATVTLGTVTIVGTGNTNITASQGGNTYFNAATPVIQSLTVGAEVFVNWTGGTSTNWYTNTNWSSNAVPGGTTNAIILSTAPNQPIITNSMSPAACQKLTINAGAVLTINAGSALTVNSTFTNSTGNTGLVILTGGSLIESTGGVAGSMTSSFTDNEWHFISSPVAAAVSGLFTGQYLMNHTELTNVYTDVTSTTAPLTPAKGFALWGDVGFSATYTGILNSGSQSSVVTRDGEGWNLVGNPYPSSIDWDAATGWTKSGVNDATYVHVNAATWATYVGSVGANGGSRYIAPGQGFIVEAAGNGTLAMSNNVRVHHATPFFKKSQSEVLDNLVRLQVSGNGYQDEAIVRLLPVATNEFDGRFDAHKLFGDVPEAPQIYTLGSTELSINTLPEAKPVTVGMRVSNSGSYTIAATEVNGFEQVILEDTKNNTFNMLSTAAYKFDFEAGENEQRFILHFITSTTGTDEQSVLAAIYSYRKTAYINLKNDVQGDIFIYNMAGQMVAKKLAAKGMNELELNNIGNYVVKVVTDKTSQVKKIFIQ